MKPRPGIFSGVAIACGLGLMTLLLDGLLWQLWIPQSLFRSSLILSQILYGWYLIRVVRPKAGRLTLPAANLVAGLCLFLLPLSDWWLLVLWALMLSLTRSVLLHRSLLPVALDLLTALAGVLFFSYLLRHSGSLPTAVWGFFLVQAVAGSLPGAFSAGRNPEKLPEDPFHGPCRQANDAIEAILRRV